MRVLIYSTAYFPFAGGAEVAVKEITDRVEDIKFVMITALMKRSLPRQEKLGNVFVYRVGIGIPFFDKLYLAVFGHRLGLKLHQKNQFDVVWSIMASYNGFAALSFKLKTQVKFLLTLQEGDPIEYILKKVRFVRGRFNKIFKNADGLQAISSYLENWGVDMGFAGRVKEIIPNGVDVKRFLKRYNESEFTHLRKELELPTDSFVLVTASRLVKKNGVGDVIKAVAKLPEKVQFVICGDGELELELKNITKELKLENRVNFLGNVSHEKLPKILQMSDAFIRPSLTEGLGNSFLEAMASRIITIATPVGGIVDFLVDQQNGFYCQPENPESIIKTVNEIMALSNEQKEQIFSNAEKLIADQYNWESIVFKMNKIFKEL